MISQIPGLLVSNKSCLMSTAEKRRLPNELLAEIANTMPAGIISLDDFMDRMQPLSAFIEPLASKFQSKSEEAIHNMRGEQKMRMLNWDKLSKAQDLLSSDKINAHGEVPFDEAKRDEFDRRQAAIDQWKNELAGQLEEYSRKFAKFQSAWERSIAFARELAGEDQPQVDQQNGQQSSTSCGGDNATTTVCEASSSRKRKNWTGNNGEEEEPVEEEMKTTKRAKQN